MSMTKYEDDQDPVIAYRDIYYLITRPNNYTRVMQTTGNIHEYEKWTESSYHDSCWSTDGFRENDRLWCEMRDEVGCQPSWHRCDIEIMEKVTVELEPYESDRSSRQSYRPASIVVQRD